MSYVMTNATIRFTAIDDEGATTTIGPVQPCSIELKDAEEALDPRAVGDYQFLYTPGNIGPWSMSASVHWLEPRRSVAIRDLFGPFGKHRRPKTLQKPLTRPLTRRTTRGRCAT